MNIKTKTIKIFTAVKNELERPSLWDILLPRFCLILGMITFILASAYVFIQIIKGIS